MMNIGNYLNNLPDRRILFIMIIILLLGLNSCYTKRAARNINKAENKVIYFNEGIKNQIDAFPSLVDKAFTITKKDTVFIPGDSAKFNLQLIQIDSLKNITERYSRDLKTSNELIDSLMNVPLGEYPKECQFIVDELQSRISRLGSELKTQQSLASKWQLDYLNIINKAITGVYEDSVFVIPYTYSAGNIELSPRVKDKFIIRDVTSEQFNVKVRKNFWQDIKFYPFLLGLIALFYFFGDFIFGLLKKGVSLLRKLIFKI